METNVNTIIHPRQPWLEAVRLARATPPPVADRPYFRCHPLSATISVPQCRANRAKVPKSDALLLPFELPSWYLRPSACQSCALALAVEAGRAPFFTSGEVLAGLARVSDPASVSAPLIH